MCHRSNEFRAICECSGDALCAQLYTLWWALATLRAPAGGASEGRSPWGQAAPEPWTNQGFYGIMAPGLRTTTRSTLSGIMNRLEWIALAWHGGIGPAAFYKLLRRFGSPRAVAEASADELRAARARLSDGQIERLRASMEAVPPIEEGAAELSDAGAIRHCMGRRRFGHRVLR